MGKVMEKVKLALTILSVAIIVVPLLVEVYAYQNNIVGLVLPPQINNLLNGGSNSNNSDSNDSGAVVGQTNQLTQVLPNLQLPQPAGQPTYNPATGAFTYPFNFTNPLKSDISVDHLSAQVVGDNGTPLGNVTISPVDIAAGASVTLNATGNLSQSAIAQLESQYQSGTLNVSLRNVNVDVGGVNVTIDRINDIGQILSQYGISAPPPG